MTAEESLTDPRVAELEDKLAHEREARAEAIKELTEAQAKVAELEDKLSEQEWEITSARDEAEEARADGQALGRIEALEVLKDVGRGILTLDEVPDRLDAPYARDGGY